MGKISNKHRRALKKIKAHALDDDTYLDKEKDDEIDAFHKQREMIPLDVNKDIKVSDGDAEEPIFDLEAYQNGGRCNGRDDDKEDDMDDEDFTDAEDKGFAAKIARQLKYLKERFGGVEDEMSDDDESDEERNILWGKNKNLYYGADNIDYELQSSDEDLLMEEKEVMRIERARAKILVKEDFGLESSDEEEGNFACRKISQVLAKKRATTKRGANVVGGITDLNELTMKERLDLLCRLVTLDDFDDMARHSKHHGSASGPQSSNKLALTSRTKKNEWEDGVKKQRTEMLAAKEKPSARPQLVPEEHPLVGRRPIPREIEQNRGLTCYRKKLTKNPRKKYKLTKEELSSLRFLPESWGKDQIGAEELRRPQSIVNRRRRASKAQAHKQLEMLLFDAKKDSGDNADDVEAYQNDRYYGRDDEEEDDMDAEHFTDVKDKGFAAKFAKQSKYPKKKFQGDDEMSDEDRNSWRDKMKRVSLYYGAHMRDYEKLRSYNEFILMEEMEVMKIEIERAKMLVKEDFGLETSDEEEGNYVSEKISPALAKERATTKRGANVANDSEVIEKDLNALSEKEQMDLVHRCAPELVGLLSEMKMAYNEFKRMKPLVSEEFKLGEETNYFEVTYMMSALYSLVITAYLILKSEGHSIRDHPVIAHILEIKVQWDKLMNMRSKFPLPVGNSINHNYESITKSNVENSPLEQEACLVDMPTKALTVPEMAEVSKDVSKNPDRKTAIKKQQKPQLDQKRTEMMKVRKNLEAKLKQNSSYSCLNLVADKTEKVLAKPISGNLVTLDDFDDEPIHSKNHGSASRHLSVNKLTQIASTKKKGWKIISGDEDLPKRDDIAERRRKYELRVLAGAGLTDDGVEGCDHNSQGINKAEAGNNLQESGKIESEDESDREVKKQRTEKLPTKAKTPQLVPEEEPAFDDRRLIPREIEENRGLTRYRKKLTKNPRKKYKIKHAKAVMCRKGQVRDIRRPTGSYGGEPTGININVSRSIRFKN